ncbi:MAG: glycosyltransferase family 2 protein [Polyangiaceae bacterium]|nr:glycosyltransferase family 2 protein [Polyangiaceae bacterium]
MSATLLAVAFWSSLALLGYTYLGYPLVLWVWARLRTRAVRRDPALLPSVTVLAVVQDEAEQVERRILNLLELDYPRDALQLVIASDGSRDDTVARARAYAHAGVEVLDFAERRGKPAALADAARVARGEILVLCDARQRIEPQALRLLVAPFADAEVGVVSGAIVLGRTGAAVGRGLGLYARYETFVRACESRIDSMLGATGALYAVRRRLFEPLPVDTLADDLVLPCRVLRGGYRVVLEAGARAVDEAPRSARKEFARKVRTLAGVCQLFARERWLFAPWRNRVWLQTVSHKGLRLLGPWLILVLVAASAVHPGPFYRVAFAAELAFFAMALLGLGAQRLGRGGPLSVPYTFCLLQVAAVVGLFRFATHRQPVCWKPVPVEPGSVAGDDPHASGRLLPR